MNLTINQYISIALVILGVNVASTAQLTDLMGPQIAKYIVSLSGLLMSIVAGIQGIISGQASQVKAVQAMPGVETIVVNAKANQTLAGLAVDPAQLKIESLPQAEKTIQSIAKGG